MTKSEGRTDLERIASGLFFIVGGPRSGTTLVQAMLSSHPRLFVPAETDFFDGFRKRSPLDRRWLERFLGSDRFADQGFDRAFLLNDLHDRSERGVFLRLMALHASRSGVPRVGEKTPQHYKRVRSIAKLFPAARFIHVMRDGRDVVASRLEAGFASDNLDRHAESWKRTARSHLACLDGMPNDRYRELRFERILQNPQGELRALCEFLNEPYDDAMLAFHTRSEQGFGEREAGWKGGTRSPLDPSKAGSWKQRLTTEQARRVETIAGTELRNLGYL